MNDAHTHGAVASTYPDLKRRTPFLVFVVMLLFFSGALFMPSPVHATQGKTFTGKATSAKPPVTKTASKPSGKKNASKKRRPLYVRSLMPAEDKAALRDRGFSSGFGLRAVSKKRVRLHKGIDVPAPKDSKIMAFNDGTVIFAGVKNGYGKTVVIRQLDGREALYAHMNKYVVRTGDAVKRGDHIGHVGRTGRATGHHLHFELIDEGEHLDPAEHVWHSAELVLGPGELELSTPPEASVAQPNLPSTTSIY